MRIQEFDFNVDLLRAILWQYNGAESIQSLLTSKKEWYEINQTEFWTDWEKDVFDLDTANDFGLAVWAIILELPLFVELFPDDPDKPIWGFDTPDPLQWKNFENGNFTSETTGAFVLTVEERRLVLQLRYFQLITRCATPEINENLARIFEPLGSIYVLDNLNMTITYVFDFTPADSLLNVLKAFDLLPRAAGVGIEYVFLNETIWGFGQYNKNFNNGTFIGVN